MRRKILSSLLAIGLLSVLIGGATLAWFTDDDVVADAEFTAGTVLVDAENPDLIAMDDKYIDNVNPGDLTKVIWKIKNTGSKAAELRVNLSQMWAATMDANILSKLEEDGYDFDTVAELTALLDTNNVYLKVLGDWEMYEENNELWLYYTGGSVQGTYNAANPAVPLDAAEVELALIIAFDGEDTDNKYMGAKLTLGGTVEAIQASNGAPIAEWGTAWETVAELNGSYEYLDYSQRIKDYSDYFNDEVNSIQLTNLINKQPTTP